MERLTERNEADTAYYYPNCFKECDGLGYSSKCNKCDFTYEICEKLGEYEDAEEQGLLLRLPAPLNGVDSFSLKENEIWQRIPCHCKDCSHWVDGCAGCTEHVKLCDVGHYMVGENGYCLYAEQKVRNNQ